MWVLKRVPEQEDDSLQFYLLPGRQYVVGRKDCDVVIAGDSTVSRKHALISITKEQQNSEYQAAVKDMSKTGVLLNDKRIEGNTHVAVKNEDVVSFGKEKISFKFILYNIKAVTSGISKPDQRSKIKKNIQKLGGTMSSDWDTYITHLIMEKITFTIKVVYALACGKMIVTPKFFDDLLDCVDQKKGNVMPAEKNYLPPVAEQTILNQENLFLPIEARKSLLVGKVFVFFTSKQHSRMKAAVEFAGGTVLLQETKERGLLRKISSTQLLFVQLENKELKELDNDQRSWIQDVYEKLKRHNLRAVDESEIGIAILFSSMERFCNPTIHEVPTLCNTSFTQSTNSTQASQQSQPEMSQLRNSSCGNEQEEDQKKRKRVESDEIVKVAEKKMKLEEEKPDSKSTRNDNKKTENRECTVMHNSRNQSKIAQQNGVNQSKVAQNNIIEIDDDDDDNDFQFDETALLIVRRTQDSNKNSENDGLRQTTQLSKISEPENIRQTRSNKNRRPENVRQTRSNEKNSELAALSATEKESRSSESEKETIFSKRTNADRTVLAQNTEFVSEKVSNVTQFTSVSKKAISDTALDVTVDMLGDFDDLDDKNDPSVFDIPDPSGLGFKILEKENNDLTKKQTNLRNQDQTSEDEDNEKLTSRFLKGMASSQDSNSGDVLMLNSQGDLVPRDQLKDPSYTKKRDETLTNKSRDQEVLKKIKIEKDSFSEGWKQTSNSTNHKSIKYVESNNKLKSENNKNENNSDKKDQNIGDCDDLSYLLDDDDDGVVDVDGQDNAMVSEEFPPASKHQLVKKDGWLSAGAMLSTSIVLKEDPDLVGISRDLIQTTFDSLVVKATQQQNKPLAKKSNWNSRNTKCFKKQLYAGCFRRNVLIRGSDLQIFKSTDEDRANMFDTFREEYDQEEEEERRITQMFNKVTR